MNRYGLTIFAGSFLLFLMQPILGKLLLPEYGGSAGVWTVCLLFFQSFLLAGYAWAHVARPRWHVGLLLISLLALPLSLHSVKAGPTASILATLALTAGLPYIALSATSPLLQRWVEGSATPYRLYALSNLGSMLALFAYPFLIEPWVTTRLQLSLWTAGYLFFALQIARFTGGATSPLALVPQILLSALLFPMISRLCAALDRWRSPR